MEVVVANNQNMLEQILGAALSGGGVRGAGAPSGGAGNLGDVLGGLLGGLAQAGAGSGGTTGSAGAGGLGELLSGIVAAAAGGANPSQVGAPGSGVPQSP